MNVAWMGLIGAMTGLHAATWGAFKDAPFEGFHNRSFVRSVILGAAVAVIIASATTLGSTAPVVVLVGLLYAGERLATEWWKTFVREDPQSAYTIPMRLAVRGRPVDARLPRYAAGLAVAGSLVVCVDAAGTFTAVESPPWLTVLVGGAGGWLTAAGGAWKDAPIEGFSGWKFLRSPVVASGWACLLLPATRDWALLAVSAGGMSVLTIETYKTFLTGGRAPGKFDGKPVRFAPRRAKEACRLLHAGLYLVLGCGLAGTLILGGPGNRVSGPLAVSHALVALFALTLSVVVGVSRPSAPRSPVAADRRRAPSCVAMLGPTHAGGAPLRAAAQEPDPDADLRREET